MILLDTNRENKLYFARTRITFSLLVQDQLEAYISLLIIFGTRHVDKDTMCIPIPAEDMVSNTSQF